MVKGASKEKVAYIVIRKGQKIKLRVNAKKLLDFEKLGGEMRGAAR